jgi:hypothetical protein
MRPRANGYDILFPFSFDDVRNVMARTALSSRALLLQEVFELTYSCPQPCTDAPPARPVILSVRPNPFNPSTVVEFTAVTGSRGSVRVFNLRGELVQTLHSGEFRTTQFSWDGTDARGAAVASGVYVVRAEAEGTTQTAKVALVK